MAAKSIFLNDKFILGIIILNTISIFVGGYFPDALVFRIADSIFTLTFLVEAIVKICNSSFKQYWADGWNRFDFVITIAALPSLLNLFMDGNIAMNILLTFRVLRIFKSFRLFRFIPNINQILNGIRLAMRASFVVALGAGILLLLLAILTSAIFGQAAPEYFGNPGTALYNTFKVFTVEGWYDIPEIISSRSTDAMGVFSKIYFAVMLFICGILGMSLINAIFVDAAVSDNNDDLMKKLDKMEEMIRELKEDGLK